MNIDMSRRQFVGLAGSLATVLGLGLVGCGGGADKGSAAGSAAAKDVKGAAESKKLVVGFDKSYPPYGFVGDDGEYTGFDLDLAKAVADKIKEWRPDMEVKIASAQGLADCKKLLMLAKAGKYNGYLLEGMGCPGGCIGGAGPIADPVRTAAVLNKYVKDATFTAPEQSAFMSNIHMLKDDPNFEV